MATFKEGSYGGQAGRKVSVRGRGTYQKEEAYEVESFHFTGAIVQHFHITHSILIRVHSYSIIITQPLQEILIEINNRHNPRDSDLWRNTRILPSVPKELVHSESPKQGPGRTDVVDQLHGFFVERLGDMASEQATHDAILERRALQLLAQNPGVTDDGGELVASGCDSACVKPLDEKCESGGIILGKLDVVEGRPPGSFSEAGSEVRRVLCEEASVERPGFEVLAAADTHADDSGVLESRSSSIILFESRRWRGLTAGHVRKCRRHPY